MQGDRSGLVAAEAKGGDDQLVPIQNSVFNLMEKEYGFPAGFGSILASFVFSNDDVMQSLKSMSPALVGDRNSPHWRHCVRDDTLKSLTAADSPLQSETRTLWQLLSQSMKLNCHSLLSLHLVLSSADSFYAAGSAHHEALLSARDLVGRDLILERDVHPDWSENEIIDGVDWNERFQQAITAVR